MKSLMLTLETVVDETVSPKGPLSSSFKSWRRCCDTTESSIGTCSSVVVLSTTVSKVEKALFIIALHSFGKLNWNYFSLKKWSQWNWKKRSQNDANLNLQQHFHPGTMNPVKAFSSANTIDKNKVRKCRSWLSQRPWKSTEINGTFMRYQMTHQIHLAVNAPQALSLALAALVHAWPCNLQWLGQSWGTHLHLPLGQPLLSGPLANVIRVTSLEGYSGHGPLTKADLPTNSPPASTSLFKVLKKKVSYFFSSFFSHKEASRFVVNLCIQSVTRACVTDSG